MSAIQPGAATHTVSGEEGGAVRPIDTIASKLRRKLGEDADHPRHIFAEPRVGFPMLRSTAADGEAGAGL